MNVIDNLTKLAVATLLFTLVAGAATASPAEMTIFPKESSTRINSFTSYKVEVTNVGPVKDRYFLSSKSSEVTIAPSDFYLEPSASKEVQVWYNPDVDKEAGRYSFTVNARSSATGETYAVDGIVNVIKEHEVNLAVEQSKTACLGEKTQYTVEVTNEGIQKEEFSLRTGYGKLSRTSLALEDGETQTVVLTASSDKPVEKNFDVFVESRTSYAQDSENVNFNAERCFASDVTVTPENQRTAAFTPAEFQVRVKNTGTKADVFTLSASEGTLGTTKLNIASGDSETTTLTVTPEKLGTRTLKVTAESAVTTTATAELEVYNGNDVAVSMPSRKVCEDDKFAMKAEVSNTGEAKDTYKLSASRGNLSVESLTLEAGESEKVNVKFDASSYSEGEKTNVKFTAASETFDQPRKSTTSSFRVQNCWDLGMNVVPKVASAGENRSVIYEIQLENTGVKQNTYELAYEGPEWVSIRPEAVTLDAGEKETAYMYAGIPFQKKGVVDITATAVGHDVKKSQTVKLAIGEDIEEAIRSDRGGGITGRFTGAVSKLAKNVQGSNLLFKLAVSIVVGAIITLVVLYREW
ncbi:MAG: hypothetical protein ABEJ69_02595 [Candidatus Nanohaloarchaea archaeon]